MPNSLHPRRCDQQIEIDGTPVSVAFIRAGVYLSVADPIRSPPLLYRRWQAPHPTTEPLLIPILHVGSSIMHDRSSAGAF